MAQRYTASVRVHTNRNKVKASTGAIMWRGNMRGLLVPNEYLYVATASVRVRTNRNKVKVPTGAIMRRGNMRGLLILNK